MNINKELLKQLIKEVKEEMKEAEVPLNAPTVNVPLNQPNIVKPVSSPDEKISKEMPVAAAPEDLVPFLKALDELVAKPQAITALKNWIKASVPQGK